MKHTTLTFSTLLLFLISAFTLEGSFWNIYPPTLQQIEATYLFEGDQHGDFYSDFVAVLSDGSEWKIHPDDTRKFSRWQLGQWVHVPVRTSGYWFKREHKFMLTNHDLGERVRVMLVRHAYQPLTILNANTYATETKLVPIYKIDGNANLYFSHYVEEPCNYRKDLYMSDGSAWMIENNFNHFTPGQFVYVGVNSNSESFNFFLINGVEREAKWTWTNPVVQ